MDLNYLLHRHQLSLMNADAAPSVEARRSHDGLARGYALSIDAMQGRMGAGSAPMTVRNDG
ncbi:hypothetical protein [Sphingomonas sp. RS2018]